jgi:hypothetical protein
MIRGLLARLDVFFLCLRVYSLRHYNFYLYFSLCYGQSRRNKIFIAVVLYTISPLVQVRYVQNIPLKYVNGNEHIWQKYVIRSSRLRISGMFKR